MPTVDAVVECPVHRSFRVDQLAGMFDVELEEKLGESFKIEIPARDEDWQVGVIVGPSGSGKSTIARKVFGSDLYAGGRWPKDAAVVDGFGDRPIKEITHMLSAVGFSSPPSWVKPYAVLSNGERFRCDLARALLCGRELVAYDEFTSVVDRTVAKIGSAAVSKAIRKGRIARKFVAVTCHYDVVEWLEPDWVADMASGRLARSRLRRPSIQLEIAPILHTAWRLFRRHHYLSTNLLPTAACFVAFWADEPVAFSAWVNRQTKHRRQGDMREHRTVVLPDFQGVGIGNRLSEFCASIWTGLGGRAFSTTSHPAMIRYRSESPSWNRIRLGMCNPLGRTSRMGQGSKSGRYEAHSCTRVTGGFEYVGPPMKRSDARRFAKRGTVQFVEGIVRRHPGATMSRLVRETGLSTSGVRHVLDELIEAGDVAQTGRGGAGGRQQSFHAIDRNS